MQDLLSTDKGNIVLRRARPEDAAAYRELRLEALRTHPTAFGADYGESARRPDNYWDERLQIDNEEEALFLAEYEGELIGMTGIYRSLSPRHRHQAMVWGVYVRDGWRGLRIAEALIRNCLEWARQKGVVIAKLGVEANNMPAIRCYERCGFSTYGLEAKALFHEGKYIDGRLMARELEPE